MITESRHPAEVGRRPGTDAAWSRSLPRGVEKLLAVGRLSPQWRGLVLADPAGAARSAGIRLSENERLVLRAISREQLERMIAAFDRALPRPSVVGRLAAAAALTLTAGGAFRDQCLAGEPSGKEPAGTDAGDHTTRLGDHDGMVTAAMLGLPHTFLTAWVTLCINPYTEIRIHVSQSSALRSAETVPDALEEAAKTQTLVRCVFRDAMPSGTDVARPGPEPSGDFREKLAKLSVWNINLFKPAEPAAGADEAAAKRLQAARAEFDATAKRFNVTKLPTVLYLSPEGKELARSESLAPADELGAMNKARIAREAVK